MEHAGNNKVKLDLRRLKKFVREIESHRGAKINNMYKQWAARYLGFARRRFVKNSRGGGNWPGLKPATVRGRRSGRTKTTSVKKRKTGGAVAILRNTGTLLGALEVGSGGNFKRLRNGVRVGFLSHSKAKTRTSTGIKPSSLSIAKLAAIHNFGKGHMPKRQIIVDPDRQTVNGMIRDKKVAINGLLRKHGK